MKVASFFFTLGLSTLALADNGHGARTNVRDLSAQSSWDSTIGKGVPALVELYVAFESILWETKLMRFLALPLGGALCSNS